LNRLLPFGAFTLFTLCLFACTPTVSPLSATSAAPVDAVASQVAENLTAAVPAPQSAPASGAAGNPGLLVVYEKSGNLWARTGSGISQITSGGTDSHPRLSADGKLVAFQRGTELWVVEASGQNPRKLYGEAGVVPLQFEFAPSSHNVYFTSAASDGAPRFDLNLVEADVNAIRPLLPAGQGGQFTFLPDGSQLALVQPDKIIVTRPDGTGAQVVHQFPPVKGPKGDYLPQIAWMENGYGFKTVIPGSDGAPARFMFIMAAGGQPAQLAQFSAAPPSVSDTYLAPDGSKLIYLKEQGGNLELHVIDASTADKTYFAYAREKFGLLGWTPDSKNILFWIDDPRSAWMSAGDTQSPLSDVSYAANVTWVDATTYLFLNESELRLRTMGQPSQVVDTGVSGEFDAILVR
jgi:dipeptidyl aminopeptidase/acylaminoacyl peptidase